MLDLINDSRDFFVMHEIRHSPRWGAHAVFVAAAASILMLSGTVHADERLQKGHDLLAQNCGSCHAVERTGASKHHLAPPFRELGKRYTIESLEEALGEGIVSGHPDMPEFEFEPEQVGAIIAYLKDLQNGKK